jgi:hypothetical protein
VEKLAGQVMPGANITAAGLLFSPVCFIKEESTLSLFEKVTAVLFIRVLLWSFCCALISELNKINTGMAKKRPLLLFRKKLTALLRMKQKGLMGSVVSGIDSNKHLLFPKKKSGQKIMDKNLLPGFLKTQH